MVPKFTLAQGGWYHSFELPDGSRIDGKISVEQLQNRWRQLQLPDDLNGKRALDIGVWDGWFSFELERRGAEVVALDLADVEGFEVMRAKLGSHVERRLASVYDLNPRDFGRFDIVNFQGVLYHLRHPLLALEKVCSVAKDILFVESYVSGDDSEPPRLEFYERSELLGQFDNWFGPNVPCLLAFCRSAGLVDVNLLAVNGNRAVVRGHAHWPPPPAISTHRAPFLAGVTSAASGAEEISAAQDEFVSLYFESDQANLAAEAVFPTIGGWGAAVAELRRVGSAGWSAICRLPPALTEARAEVSLWTIGTASSNVLRIEILDLPETPREEQPAPAPVNVEAISIEVVADGKTWERNVMSCPEHYVSLWVTGLPDEIRAEHLRVTAGDSEMTVLYLSGKDPADLRQINVQAPSSLAAGQTEIRVSCGAVTSPAAVLVNKLPPRS